MFRSRLDTARNADVGVRDRRRAKDAFRALLDNESSWTPDEPLLSLQDLNVSFLVGRKLVHIVRDVNLDVMPKTVLCIVGETGCGKSVTATAALHLLPDNARVSGSVLYRGVEVSSLSDEEFRHLRGSGIMNVPQNPNTSLDPLMRVGDQVSECVFAVDVVGRDTTKGTVRDEVVRLFEKLRFPDAAGAYRRYPAELSGGMNQRVLISMGAITHPALLVVDEPTKAIDWSLRRDVLNMLRGLKEDTSCAMLLITHDIPLARLIADRVAVMYAGCIVESGPADEVLHHPLHPYTQGLLNSLPENGFKAMNGFMPSFDELPEGCPFWPRCPHASETCKCGMPPAYVAGDRVAYCNRPLREGGVR
ncbi:MAG: ABC transporter ATP-binding protein [Eggerthellaceae bacterium]|nr:ABC transporter ATP-binding protein [Eggerthellaceae bacterium]